MRKRTAAALSIFVALSLAFSAVALGAPKAPIRPGKKVAGARVKKKVAKKPVKRVIKKNIKRIFKPVKKLPDVFYLGMPGRSGCYVCHGNQLLIKNIGGKMISFYIDKNSMDVSPHKNVACTACHRDFTAKNHRPTPKNWKVVASLSCIRCHKHKKQYGEYIKSIHGQRALRGQKGATCGDCHDVHNIKTLKDKKFRVAFQLSSKEVCGKCHLNRYNNYDDYYHGRAYRRMAPDAPACWECHGSHKILPTKEPNSMVNPKNLPKTCEKCHPGSTKNFCGYASAIHGTEKLKSENPLFVGKKFLLNVAGGMLSSALKVAGGLKDTLVSWFTGA